MASLVFYHYWQCQKETTMNKQEIQTELEKMKAAMAAIESLLADEQKQPETTKSTFLGRRGRKILSKKIDEPKAEAQCLESKSPKKAGDNAKSNEEFYDKFSDPLLEEGDGLEIKKYFYHVRKYNKREKKWTEEQIKNFVQKFREGKDDVQKRRIWLQRQNFAAKQKAS